MERNTAGREEGPIIVDDAVGRVRRNFRTENAGNRRNVESSPR